jgi:hypothetical protein
MYTQLPNDSIVQDNVVLIDQGREDRFSVGPVSARASSLGTA